MDRCGVGVAAHGTCGLRMDEVNCYFAGIGVDKGGCRCCVTGVGVSGTEA